MIEYLESLLAQREDRKALEYAEQLLRSHENRPEDLLRIYSAMLLARHNLGEYRAALEAGELARALAQDLEHWDRYGEACINMSATYGKLDLPEKAMSTLYDYLGFLPKYGNAKKYELMALQIIGRVHVEAGRFVEAKEVFARMTQSARRHQTLHQEVVAKLSVVECSLKLRQFQDVPRLMAQCAKYFRANAANLGSDDGPLVLTRYRATHALLTGRLFRSALLALRGEALANGMPRHLYEFQKILSLAAAQKGCVEEAESHGLAARSYAMACNRQDLVIEANQFLYGIDT